jgi:hypothetical protein
MAALEKSMNVPWESIGRLVACACIFLTGRDIVDPSEGGAGGIGQEP